MLAFGDGVDTASAPVEVLAPTLLPEFEATPGQGVAPLSVSFAQLAEDDALGWHWDFGDGSTSAEPAPTHTYWTPGPHDVTLSVSASSSSATWTQHAAVIVDAPSVMQPAFTHTPHVGVGPLEVAFLYTGTGAEPAEYHWDFGDGGVSDLRDPLHVYTQPGVFDVSVTTTLGGVVEGTQVLGSVTVELFPVAFAPPSLQPVVPALSTLRGVADVTGDGVPDLLATGDDLTVLPGLGDGSLAEAVVTVVPGAYSTLSGAADIGDLDLDGRADVIGLVQEGDHRRLDIQLASGAGQFVAGEALPLSWPDAHTTRPLLADVFGDGRLDLVATHALLLSVFPGDGAGGLLPPLPTQPTVLDSGFHTRLTAFDLDLDGQLDIHARFQSASGTHWVAYVGDGTGLFETACGGSAGDHSTMGASLVGEVDGDGFPDIVAKWGVPHCSGPGVPELSTPLSVSSWPNGCDDWNFCEDVVAYLPAAVLAVTDLDGHHADDLLTWQSAEGLAVRPSTGGTNFGSAILLPGQPQPRLVADLDGDGLPELIGLDVGAGDVWVSRNLTPVAGWTDLGFALAAGGFAPGLDGSGGDAPDDLIELALHGAPPNTAALLVLGFAAAELPLHGGVLVPTPHVIAPWLTDAEGEALLRDRWPPALGPGTQTWWQVWIPDPTSPTASNALRHIVPSGG